MASSISWHIVTTVQVYCSRCGSSRIVRNDLEPTTRNPYDLDTADRQWLFAHCRRCEKSDDWCVCDDPKLCEPSDDIPF